MIPISLQMTENTDRTRALRAEKQVERLERELELIKSRLKVNVKINECNIIRFRIHLCNIRNQRQMEAHHH